MEIYMDELTHDFPFELGGDFEYLETIDHGSFGTVIHVLEKSSNKDMALKVINKNNSRQPMIKKVKEEISILRKLNHENIVKFFGFFETNNQLFIKMEYIKYGTLSQWIKNHRIISEEEASIIIRRILSAIVYLHSKQICHRDIKPENIMLSKENDLNSIKIIDFGLSAQNFEFLINNDYCGTYIYMAPEQIEKKLYCISVDIWSIGILMFILLNNGNHPFYIKGDNKKDFVKKIMERKIKFYNKISPMAKHLIFKLLEPNSSRRYSGVQALKHPWITRNINDEIPLTFNEILVKSNNKKIAKDLFNICLFMNYFSKKKKIKFFINEKYIHKCNLYNEKIKEKINEKKEKCLDILSTNEEDNFEQKLNNDKKYFYKKIGNSKSLRYKKIKQSKTILSSKKITKNKISEYKAKNLKFSFGSSIYRKFVEEKILNFKKLNYQDNTSINNKAISQYKNNIGNVTPNRKNSNNNLFKSFCVTSNHFFKKLRNQKNKYINESNFNDNKNSIKDNEYKIEKNQIKKINPNFEEDKSEKQFKYYSNKKILNHFPHIILPLKIKYLNKPKFSLNDSENNKIASIDLPNLQKSRKPKNLKYKICKKNMIMKKLNEN